MENQKKNYSGLITLAVVLGILAIFVAAPLMTYINAKNNSVRFEADIVRLDKASEIELSNHTNKILEMVQVPKMQTEHLTKLAKEALSARYGEDGSKALFQFIKENTAAPSEKLYLDLQATIAGGRQEFKLSQDVKIDRCTQYEIWRESFPTSIVAGFLGLPTKKLTGRCEIITDDLSRQAFETKRTSAIKLN